MPNNSSKGTTFDLFSTQNLKVKNFKSSTLTVYTLIGNNSLFLSVNFALYFLLVLDKITLEKTKKKNMHIHFEVIL